MIDPIDLNLAGRAMTPQDKAITEFVRHNLTLLAAFSWGCCQQHGKGAILVDFTRRVPQEMVPAGMVDARWMTYLPLSQVEKAPLGADDKATIRRMVGASDPSTGAVLVSMLSDSEITILRFRTIPAPPDAFEDAGESLRRLVEESKPSWEAYKRDQQPSRKARRRKRRKAQ